MAEKSLSLPSTRVPVSILTGFLGSGKTTLLRELLADPAMRDTAVLVNEVGDIGIDHHLVAAVHGEVVLLKSGCICCSIRSDLVRALCDLWVRAERQEIPRFSKVIVETTGLADPTPILATLIKNGLVARVYGAWNVITTADVEQIESQWRKHSEVGKQLAMADRIVVTKCDRVDAAALTHARAVARAASPAASMYMASNGIVNGGWFDTAPPDVNLLLTGALRATPAKLSDGLPADVLTRSLVLTDSVDLDALDAWLTKVAAAHGDTLLRVKGLVQVRDREAPVLVQTAGHVVYPHTTLATWPTDDRGTRVVLIARGMQSDVLDQVVAAFPKRVI